MTIDELMKDKQPGEVKVRSKFWQTKEYFIPYFKTKDGDWNGPDDKGEHWASGRGSDSYELYIEPRQQDEPKSYLVTEAELQKFEEWIALVRGEGGDQ